MISLLKRAVWVLTLALLLADHASADQLPHLLEITSANFSDSLTAISKDYDWVLMEFYAHWCPVCKAFQPTYAEVAAHFGSRGQAAPRIAVARVDCPDNPDLCEKFEIGSYPTMYLGNTAQFSAHELSKLIHINPNKRTRENIIAAIAKEIGVTLATLSTNGDTGNTKTNTNIPIETTKMESNEDSAHLRVVKPLNYQQNIDENDIEGAVVKSWEYLTAPALLRGIDTREALEDWIDLLADSHPVERCRKGAENAAEVLISAWPAGNEEAAFPAALHDVKICGDTIFQDWTGCKGSLPSSRGYTCSLWQLFHTLSARLPENDARGGARWMTAIRGFAKHFFQCSDCARNFVKHASSPAADQILSKKEAVLWIWSTHNLVNARLKKEEEEASVGDPEFPKIQWPPEELCPTCSRIGNSQDSTVEREWDEDAVYEFLLKYYGGGGGSSVLGINGVNNAAAAAATLNGVFLKMYRDINLARCAGLCLIWLMLVCTVRAAGPVGPFTPNPGTLTGSATSEPGKCTERKGAVYLSTFINGEQLNNQGFEAPMGNVYFRGPRLTMATSEGDGEWCNYIRVNLIPPMATGLVTFGISKHGGIETTIFDVQLPKSYDPSSPYKPVEMVDCGCKIKVEIYSRATSGTIVTTSSLQKNLNKVSIDGTCVDECSSLTVYQTQNWCSEPVETQPERCDSGTFGANAFVYFEGLDATAAVASIDEDAYAGAEGPSSSENGAPSSPSSSAFKATPLPLLITMLALFGVVSNKRVLFVTVLLLSVAGARAQPPGWRESLGAALGTIVGNYMSTVGKCTAYMSEAMIKTSIDGKNLKYYFHPSPVGDASYTGPKLELLGSRTDFAYGDYCGASAPSVIPPNDFGNIIIGDSSLGLASPEVTLYYKVFKLDGSPSNCVLKLYMNDREEILQRFPIYSLTEEGDCSDVPTLQINQVKKYGCGKLAVNGGCGKDQNTGVNYYSTGFNVYFDGEAAAQPTSIDGNFTASGSGSPVASESSSEGNSAAPPAPSAAMPFRAMMTIVGTIALSAMTLMK